MKGSPCCAICRPNTPTPKSPFRASKKPLEFNADGTYNKMQWHDDALTMGQAARLGDKLQITKVTLEGDHIIFEINGGLKSGDNWYNHVQVRHGRQSAGNESQRRAGETGHLHRPQLPQADGESHFGGGQENPCARARFR